MPPGIGTCYKYVVPPTLRYVPALLPAILMLAPCGVADGSVRGEFGWSSDGLAYGTCQAWILPDSTDGCRFFDLQSRKWVTLGRREALALWRPWEPEVQTGGGRPILAVYPMQQEEDNPGPVTLLGRLVPSDDVVEIWQMEGDVRHGVRGGEWLTIFDYSPDGIWLAAGAVHVDHESSANEFHVMVRPVTEWLALAHLRLGLEKMSGGDIVDGLRHLARARELLTPKGAYEPETREPREDTSPLGEEYVDDDPLHERTFARWSTDGKTFCTCESWRDITGEAKTRCRIIQPGQEQWTPVLVNLVHTHCPGHGKPPAKPAHPPAVRVWADGGYDGQEASVVVYLTGGPLGNDLGAVVEKSWAEEVSRSEGFPAFFHPVGVPSPTGRYLAVGYLVESATDAENLHHDVSIAPFREWVQMARAEHELHQRTDPVTLQDAVPDLELPTQDAQSTDDEDPHAPQDPPGGSACGGCSVSWIP